MRSVHLAKNWGRWRLAVVDADQGIVEIYTSYPKKYGAPRCADGELVPFVPESCYDSEVDIKKAAKSLSSPSTRTWKLVHVKQGVYNIVANSRQNGCQRYLGVSSTCKSIQLYAKDDNTGAQRWIILPDLHTATPAPASGPSLSQETLQQLPAVNFQTSITGYTAQTFGIQQQSAFCTALLNSIAYPPNLMQCTVVNISDSQFLPTKSHDTRQSSAPQVDVQGYVAFMPSSNTLAGIGSASNAAVQTTAALNNPQQASAIFSPAFPDSTMSTQAILGTVNSSLPTSPAQSSPSLVPSPVSSPTIVQPSPVSSPVVQPSPVSSPIVQPSPVSSPIVQPSSPVSNPVPLSPGGAVITSPQPIPVPVPVPGTPSGPTASAPNAATNVQSTPGTTSWAATWTDGSPAGVPAETYSAKCVASGSPCTASAVGTPATNIARGGQAGSVTGLTAGTTYSCYVIASNGIGTPVCSAAASVTAGTAPNTATNVQGTPGTTSWAATWTDGSPAGVPAETYSAKCVASGSPCTASAVGTPATNIARGGQAGSVTGLTAGTTYSCYVIASNGIGTPVCSAAASITTFVNRNWRSIASSSDGTKLAAVASSFGQIYTSTDSGATWMARGSADEWTSIASSSDGTKLAAAAGGGSIYTSTDSGATWTARGPSGLVWATVASSPDGTKLAAAESGGLIYKSSDSGVTWSNTGSSQIFWSSLAISSDGSQLAATASNEKIYTSTDSGGSFTARASSLDWSAIAASSTFTNLAATAKANKIYTSTDSGVSWTARGSSLSWRSIASSSDGTKLAAAAYNNKIYTSTDSGATWTATGLIAPWMCIASSSDGTKLAACAFGGQIYTSTDSGATWTKRF